MVWQMPIGNRVFSGAEWPAVAGPTKPPHCWQVWSPRIASRNALPLGPKRRWRKWALIRYRAWQRAFASPLCGQSGPAGSQGRVSIARVVDLLTVPDPSAPGALPALYSLLEILQVRQIINRHVPTQAQVDYGMVALVLIITG